MCEKVVEIPSKGTNNYNYNTFLPSKKYYYCTSIFNFRCNAGYCNILYTTTIINGMISEKHAQHLNIITRITQ